MPWEEQPPGSGNWVDVPDNEHADVTVSGVRYVWTGTEYVPAPGIPAPAPGSPDALSIGTVRYDSEGNAYVWDGETYRYNPALNNITEGTYRAPSVSYSTSQSFADPSTVELQREQLAEQVKQLHKK